MDKRRRVPRYLYGGRGELILPAVPSPAEVIVLSISVQGCRVQGSKLPTAGQQCELKFDWQGKEFGAKGEVAWKGGDETAGLRFLTVDEVSRETLKALCANLRLEPLGPRPVHF